MDIEYEHRLTEVETRSKANECRLNKVEQKQTELGDLVTSVKVLAEREKNVENDVKEIKATVKTIAEKPGKRWEAIIVAGVTAVVSIMIGYIFAKLGIVG